MSEFPRLEAEGYLNKKLEPKKERAITKSEPFFDDGFEAIYNQQEKGVEGVIEHSDEKKSIIIKYKEVDGSMIPRLKPPTPEETEKQPLKEEEKQELNDFISDGLIEITDLTISRPGIKQSVNIRDFLPNDFVILCNTKLTRQNDMSSEASRKFILLVGNPTDLDVLLSFFHEIGHLQLEEKFSVAVDRANKDLPINKQEAATILKSERDAWAFALATLRPFLSSNNKEYISNIVHHDSLQSHSDRLRNMVYPYWAVWLMKYFERKFRKNNFIK